MRRQPTRLNSYDEAGTATLVKRLQDAARTAAETREVLIQTRVFLNGDTLDVVITSKKHWTHEDKAVIERPVQDILSAEVKAGRLLGYTVES